jgi:hypothetical protein
MRRTATGGLAGVSACPHPRSNRYVGNLVVPGRSTGEGKNRQSGGGTYYAVEIAASPEEHRLLAMTKVRLRGLWKPAAAPLLLFGKGGLDLRCPLVN